MKAISINATLLLVFLLLSLRGYAFAPSISIRTKIGFDTITSLHDRRLDDDIEQASLRKAKNGIGETAAGAVLGGLLLGPFGALFGASIGSNFGAKNAVNRARQEEMERLGVNQDMLDMAQEIGVTLERSIEGLKATQEALQTQQRLARILDRDSEELYDKAKIALADSKEDEARKLLLARTQAQEKLKKVLIQCAEDKKRLNQMERNVASLEERAMEVDSVLRRALGAKAMQDTSGLSLSLESEDPLLKKFRDLGID